MRPLQAEARVVDAAPEGPYRRLRLHVPPIAARLRPGQFVTADLGEPLRHPLLPAAVGPEGLDLLLPPDHPAATLGPGDAVGLLGPLGRPLHLPAPPARLLFAAEAALLPALLPAIHHGLARRQPVALVLSAATADLLYPPPLLPPAVEVHVVTADGSAGRAGSLLQPLPDLLPWADRVLLATDPALYPALAETVRAVRLNPNREFAQALLLPTLVCGVGACRACAVPTRQGHRRTCTDGPFLNLLDLEAG